MSLGKAITRLRQKRDWTQAELAEKVEMTTAHINRLENDRMKPRPRTLERLASVLGVSPEELKSSPEAAVPKEISQQEPELAQLLSKLSLLDGEQRQALTVFLRSMITCQQVQRLTAARAS
jgi:transcriptional regulator with XRE-family HTH domain